MRKFEGSGTLTGRWDGFGLNLRCRFLGGVAVGRALWRTGSCVWCYRRCGNGDDRLKQAGGRRA